MLDIRYPIGFMFTLLGLIISVYGMATGSSEIYRKSLGLNINLIMGLVMLVFGLFMLFLAFRKKKG